MTSIKVDDSTIESLRAPFHQWKHDNQITTLIFDYLRKISDDLHTQAINNAKSPLPIDQKMYIYYACTAKLELITELLTLRLEDMADEELNNA
ncbi:MAG: hypothetical protein WC917_00410 [Bacilli bacterium]|jgi:hypothetical protein